jgi:hypothetical protein
MFRRIETFILTICFLLPSTARPAEGKSQSGQTSGVPLATLITRSTSVGASEVDVPVDTLDDWARYYASNQWEPLQRDIIDKLNGAEFSIGLGAVDFSDDYYMVVFAGPGPSADRDLIPVLVHARKLGDQLFSDVRPYSTVLPGRVQIRQIFVDQDEHKELMSYYLSTPVPNPLIAQATKAGQALKLPGASPGGGKIAGLLDETQPQPNATPKPQIKLRLHISVVDLPIKRASISVQSRVVVIDPSAPDKPQAPQDALKSQYSLTNAPPVWYSLSSIAGGVLEPGRRNQQYKVQANVLTANPLSVTTAIIGLNLFPWGSSNDTSTLSWPQRFRVVPGLAVAPTLAPTFGGAFLVVDGFSLNAGVAWFRVTTLAPGESPNKAPVSTKPTRLGWERLIYIGLGYNFN